ncbi:CNEP1 phosphatase, partial [Copsychus sechellarum]|nr:CNEP1 phosphatase [Copsychus sechellarum]
MMRSQCLLGLRSFVAFAAKLWSFVLYLLRRQARTIFGFPPDQVKRKILVLDLDETLIHSHHDGVLRPTVRPGTPPDFILKVVIDKHPVRFFVHKRPHVDFFLEVVTVLWACPSCLWVCPSCFVGVAQLCLGAWPSCLGRVPDGPRPQHCTLELGSYIKDLSVVHSDLSSIVILDNSPGAYRSHP